MHSLARHRRGSAWLAAAICALLHAPAQSQTAELTFSLPEGSPEKPLDGRLLLLLSTDASQEPRMQISVDTDWQLVFGADVENLKTNTVSLPASAFRGYPVGALADVASGDYFVQAVFHRYE